MNPFDLTGQRALVLGAAGDLGAAMLESLLDAGASAVAIDIHSNVSSLALSLRLKGKDVHALQVDIRDRDAVAKSVSASQDLLGGCIDILVNAAGIQRRGSSELFSMEDWDDVLAVNLTAGFLYSQQVAKGMLAQGRGKIIHVASIMSNFGGITIPAYVASKGGLAQLTKALSNDWAHHGICVNAIAPGYMDTQLNTALKDDEHRMREIISRIPIGRWGAPSDMKGITLFLASSASDYITGTVIPVDGGYSAR